MISGARAKSGCEHGRPRPEALHQGSREGTPRIAIGRIWDGEDERSSSPREPVVTSTNHGSARYVIARAERRDQLGDDECSHRARPVHVLHAGNNIKRPYGFVKYDCAEGFGRAQGSAAASRSSTALGAASRVHGYEGATVARLEQEIGLSRGAIFNYFPSKDALFVELAIEIVAPLYGHLALTKASAPCSARSSRLGRRLAFRPVRSHAPRAHGPRVPAAGSTSASREFAKTAQRAAGAASPPGARRRAGRGSGYPPASPRRQRPGAPSCPSATRRPTSTLIAKLVEEGVASR